jgi:hypothetical protein
MLREKSRKFFLERTAQGAYEAWNSALWGLGEEPPTLLAALFK